MSDQKKIVIAKNKRRHSCLFWNDDGRRFVSIRLFAQETRL